MSGDRAGCEPDAGERVRLFVYGTLRSGGPAARLLAGGRRLGADTVAGTLYAVGDRYPAAVLDGAQEIHGEVWEVPATRLPALDAYEGVGDGLFRRESFELRGEPCWIYVAGARLEAVAMRRIDDGRWPPRDG